MNPYYEAVEALRDKKSYLRALETLAGGIGARQVRGKVIPPERLAALI